MSASRNVPLINWCRADFPFRAGRRRVYGKCSEDSAVTVIVSPSECCSASAAATGASPSAAERRPCEIGPFWMDSAGRSLAPAWSHSLALYEIEKKGGRETQWAIQKGGFEYYLVTAHFPARCPFQRLSESRADGRPEGEATWDRRSLWHLHTAAVWPFHLTLYSPQRPVPSFFFHIKFQR